MLTDERKFELDEIALELAYDALIDYEYLNVTEHEDLGGELEWAYVHATIRNARVVV